jgi:flagellin-like hook-associated protein FlgL
MTDNGSAATISGIVPDVRFYNEHIYQLRITDGAGGYEIIDLDANDTVIDSGTLAGPPDTITVAGMEITFSAGALAQGDVFTIVPQYAYNGTDDDIGMQVDENNIFIQNVKGTDPFGGAEPTGTVQNPGGTIFDDLVELRRALLTDDQPAIQSGLNTVSGQIDNLTQVRANVGGRISNLRNLQTRSQTELTDLLIEASKIENANLPQAITQLIQTQSGLQAALQAGARIGQLNLFDVLG